MLCLWSSKWAAGIRHEILHGALPKWLKGKQETKWRLQRYGISSFIICLSIIILRIVCSKVDLSSYKLCCQSILKFSSIKLRETEGKVRCCGAAPN